MCRRSSLAPSWGGWALERGRLRNTVNSRAAMSGAGQGSTRICGSVVSRNAMEMSGLRKLRRCSVRNLQTAPRARPFLLWAAAALARAARLAYRVAPSRGHLAPLPGTAQSRGRLAPLGQSRLPGARKSGSIELRPYHGGVAERLNAAVLKTVGRLVRLESSNLSSSAMRRRSAPTSMARALFCASPSLTVIFRPAGHKGRPTLHGEDKDEASAMPVARVYPLRARSASCSARRVCTKRTTVQTKPRPTTAAMVRNTKVIAFRNTSGLPAT